MKQALKMLITLITLLLSISIAVPVFADGPGDGGPEPIDVGPQIRAGLLKAPDFTMDDLGAPTSMDAQGVTADPVVGETMRMFLFSENVKGWTNFTLGAINELVEVWVADEAGMAFPAGDPRPPLTVRQEQVDYFAAEFRDNIWPSDVNNFGMHELRDGTQGLMYSWGFTDYTTDIPTRTMMLVFNIEDDNFDDPTYPSYIVGYYSSDATKTLYDRNIIHIDAAYWDTRVGPPGTDWGAGEVTRPNNYEGTVTHEFQHLIHSDRGQGEDNWINEGCSEYSEYLAGYTFGNTHGRTQFLTWPENALLLWGDQNDDEGGFEVLADYQNVYLWTLRLGHKYGNELIKALVDEDTAGVPSFNKVYSGTTTFMDEFEGFSKEVIYGADTDDAWMQAQGWGSVATPITPTFELSQLLENLDQEGYDKPGAPPYGSDYIKIFPGDGLGEVTFVGDTSVPATRWETVSTLPITASGSVSGNVLYSNHSNFDERWIIFDVAAGEIPTGTLSFDTFYNIEYGWDYGFVQVTEDTTGMTGWTSLENANTVTETDVSAPATIKNNVPGLSGLSEISPTYWTNQIFDISAYTDTDILLAFRYAADWATAGDDGHYPPGWWIDNVQVDDTVVWDGDTVVGGESLKEAQGWVPDFKVDFYTYDASNPVGWNDVSAMTLSANLTGTLDLAATLDADEFGVLSVMGLPPYIDYIMGYGITEYLPYTLDGLPASIATSDVSVAFEGDDAYPGGLVTYTINIRNVGSVTATVDVTSTVPANTTFIATDGVHSSGTVQWSGVEVPPNSLVAGTLTVEIDECVAIDTLIANTTDFDGDKVVDTEFDVASPFGYSSIVAPDIVPTETDLTYQLNLINMDTTTRTIQVEMVVPDNTQLVAPADGTVVANTLTFTRTVPPFMGTPMMVNVTLYISDTFLAPGSAVWPINQVVNLYDESCTGVYNTLNASTDVVPLVRMTGVSIGGPTEGYVNSAYTFVATVSPITATTPISYTWEATEQDPVSNVDTDIVAFTWITDGVKTITVTVENPGGSQVSTPYTITISNYYIYLPMVVKDYVGTALLPTK